MKISLLAAVLSAGLAVHGAAIVLADTTAYNETEVAVIPARTNSSYALDADARSLEERDIQKRGLLKLIVGVGLSLVGVNCQFAMGVGSLVEDSWEAAVTCGTEGFNLNCINACADAALTLWDNFYEGNDGINRHSASVDADGEATYSKFVVYSDGTNHTITHTQHMVLGNYPTVGHMLSVRLNASEWAHVSTRTYGNTHQVKVFHRRTNSTTDEGDANGDLNHVRAYHSKLSQAGASKRTEDRDDGVVLDYLWDSGNQGEWNQIHNGTPPVDAVTDGGEIMTGQFQDDSSIAECCTLGTTDIGDLNGGSFQAENHGVMAFGWNNQAFGFSGRAGGWVSGCASK